MKRFLLCTVIVFALFAGMTNIHLAGDTRTITQVSTTHKVVALTLDDGPHYKVTPEILAILKEKQVKATFFVLGENVEHSPNLLAEEVSNGHEIGIHTYSHASLPKLSHQRMVYEFDKAEQVVIPLAPKPVLFRPPGGFYNADVIDTARQRGYTVVLWSVDPKDWSCPPASTVVEKVIENIQPGSIILLHDGQYPIPTIKALGMIIDRLREHGYQFVTVSELLKYDEVRPSFNFLDRVRW
ncbi:hypothetical protein SDC9_05953 [bioreactor metagenome]|uniref:NodB homology domain-containing protein n=1 Tax=bioreactor metagenome TaxID=1076179 RepID=A0A644T2E9_9ZZZZ